MGMFFLIDLHMHCKSGQSVDVPPLYSTWTVCQMLAVDTVNLHASCLGTFDQKEILGPSPTANLSGLGTSAVWHEAILGGIFLWVMWSGRHYMLPVITLCHMLSFNCFSYLNVVFTVFFFSFICIVYSIYTSPSYICHEWCLWLSKFSSFLSSCVHIFMSTVTSPVWNCSLFSLRDVSSDYSSCCHFVPSIHIFPFKFTWCLRTTSFAYLFDSIS